MSKTSLEVTYCDACDTCYCKYCGDCRCETPEEHAARLVRLEELKRNNDV